MFGKFSSKGEMMLKGSGVTESFYPFVENGEHEQAPASPALEVRNPARIAVFDDLSAAPRVVVVEPKDVRSYLEEITATVTRLAQEQGGKIPFTVIREVVENLIHAYFIEPTVSILDGGNTIRFSDQGPGIHDKERALEFGTTSATAEMKRYIRGVGSGLPYAQQWLEDKGGSLTVEDNIHKGTVVTISLAHGKDSEQSFPQAELAQVAGYGQQMWPQGGYPQQAPQQAQPAFPQQPAPQGQPAYQQGGWPAPQPFGYQPQYGYPQQPMYGQAWPQQVAPYPQPVYQQQPTPFPQPQQAPSVSERGMMALQYLMTHESVGPRDLNAVLQLSESTWSRVLSQLEDQGLISKQGGQKRKLTQAGRQFLGMQ